MGRPTEQNLEFGQKITNKIIITIIIIIITSASKVRLGFRYAAAFPNNDE